MALALYHPEVPTCEQCQKWMYDAQWQKVLRLQCVDGQLAKFPLARPPGSPTPCAKCPKSGPSDGNPRPDKELTPRNAQALNYFYLCKVDTTGLLPRDEIVLRNNAIIARLEENKNGHESGFMPLLLSLLGARVK